MKKIKAFTMAEVLITLSILGVVAAITISNVIRHDQEVQTVTKVKKSYETLSNALRIAIAENGAVSKWNFGHSINEARDNAGRKSADIVLDNLVRNLSTSAICHQDDANKAGKCAVAQADITTFDGRGWSENPAGNGYASAVLRDGTYLYINTAGSTCYSNHVANPANPNDWSYERVVCAYAKVDINGNKGPNRMGVDMFEFLITPNSLIPAGHPSDGYLRDFDKSCNKNRAAMNANGYGCTYKIIDEGTMRYLHE